MQEKKDRPMFNVRLADVLGYPGTDPAMITLRVATNGNMVIGVALKAEGDRVIRGNEEIPVSKATPNRILSVAESLHATLAGAIAIFAASTPGFEEESDG